MENYANIASDYSQSLLNIESLLWYVFKPVKLLGIILLKWYWKTCKNLMCFLVCKEH